MKRCGSSDEDMLRGLERSVADDLKERGASVKGSSVKAPTG